MADWALTTNLALLALTEGTHLLAKNRKKGWL
jgi:hypothetical protein